MAMPSLISRSKICLNSHRLGKKGKNQIVGGSTQCESVQPIPRQGQTAGPAPAEAPATPPPRPQDFGRAPEGGPGTCPAPAKPWVFIHKHGAESALLPLLEGLLLLPFPFLAEAEGQQLWNRRSWHPLRNGRHQKESPTEERP